MSNKCSCFKHIIRIMFKPRWYLTGRLFLFFFFYHARNFERFKISRYRKKRGRHFHRYRHISFPKRFANSHATRWRVLVSKSTVARARADAPRPADVNFPTVAIYDDGETISSVRNAIRKRWNFNDARRIDSRPGTWRRAKNSSV